MERCFAKTTLKLIYRLHNSLRGESQLEKKSWQHSESMKGQKIQSVGLQSFYSVRPSKSVLKLNSIPTVIISSISLEIELVLPQMLVFSNMDTITFSSLCSFVFVQVIDAIQKWKSHLGCISFSPWSGGDCFSFLLFCSTFLEEMEKVAELSVSYFIGALSHFFFKYILCWPDILGSDWCVHVASLELSTSS